MVDLDLTGQPLGGQLSVADAVKEVALDPFRTYQLSWVTGATRVYVRTNGEDPTVDNGDVAGQVAIDGDAFAPVLVRSAGVLKAIGSGAGPMLVNINCVSG